VHGLRVVHIKKLYFVFGSTDEVLPAILAN